MGEIKILDVVALAVPIPEKGLVTGQVGTVVEKLAAEVYEVEFCDSDGKAYAMTSLKKEQLILLHYEPVKA